MGITKCLFNWNSLESDPLKAEGKEGMRRKPLHKVKELCSIVVL
jgi:hypothetical protein